MDDFATADGVISFTQLNDHLFYTKTTRWAEEKEYRMVRPLADLPEWCPLAERAHRDQRVHLSGFAVECVVSVTFGACMAVANKTRIIKACEGTDIQFLQAIIRRGEEDTCSVACADAANFPSLVEMADVGMIADQEDAEERNREPIVIGSLDELPYHVGNERSVRQYLENRRIRLGT